MPWLETTQGQLYYQVEMPAARSPGAPQTVLFCHGVGTNCDIWSSWGEVLGEHFKVVRFDTRGFGRSAAARDGVPWNLDRLADDILAVAGAANATRFHLVGESLGGTVALHLATRRNAPLLSLTVASTAYRGDLIGAVGKWRDELAAEGIGPWSKRMMGQRFVDGGVSEDAWRRFETVQAQTAPDALLGAADLLIGSDLSDRLANISVPTLIINSDGSPYVTPLLAADLHARIEAAELWVIPNSRHGIVFSHGDRCARALVDFIDRRAPVVS